MKSISTDISQLQSQIIPNQQFQSIIHKQNNFILKLFDQKISKLQAFSVWQTQESYWQKDYKNITKDDIQNKEQILYIKRYVGQFKLTSTQNINKQKYGLGKEIILRRNETNTWIQICIYIGQWSDNNKHGNGIEIDSQGNRYQGTWVKNIRRGFGIEKIVNGNKYEGQWKQGLKFGRGIQYYGNLKQTYEGTFKQGKKQGQGKYSFKSGELFKGHWQNDRKQGKGIIIFYNGDVFKGFWLNNLISGEGCLKYKNGDYFKGNYQRGMRKGLGTYIFVSGQRIQGQWQGDNQCVGRALYNNGDIFEGRLYKGDRCGEGTYYYCNGNKYEGNWQLNEKSGFGKYNNKQDGRSFEGQWSHNKSLFGEYRGGVVIRQFEEKGVDYLGRDEKLIDVRIDDYTQRQIQKSKQKQNTRQKLQERESYKQTGYRNKDDHYVRKRKDIQQSEIMRTTIKKC